jgi:hypothetical protein
MAKKNKSSKKNQEKGPVLIGDKERPVTLDTKPKKKSKKKKVAPPEPDEVAPRQTSGAKTKDIVVRQEDLSQEHGDDQHDNYDEEANQGPLARRNMGRTGPPPMDDFSVMSDDNSEYDPTTDEPRFAYSTAELADNSCRTSNCCVITVAIICLIVAIALSVVMVKVLAQKDAENSEAPPTMAPTAVSEANQPGLGLFQLPRDAVEQDRCPLGQDDSDACRNECEKFDCCDPRLEASCFLYNPDGCLNYKRCHVTTSGIQIPQLDLASICAPASIASNREACENECARVACCWESNVTCYDKFYACLDYSPCQNLRANSRVPSATSEVEVFCDTTQAGSVTQTTACDDACTVAECCWSSSDNCLETDLLACLTYYPCKQLTLPETGNTVKVPPVSISNDCSVALINSGKTGNCKTSCSAGTCCSDAESSCFDLDPLACLAYEPCRALALDV